MKGWLCKYQGLLRRSWEVLSVVREFKNTRNDFTGITAIKRGVQDWVKGKGDEKI